MGVMSIERLNSEQRAYLHLAGVFANNYTMAMAGIAKDLLDVSSRDGVCLGYVAVLSTKSSTDSVTV